MGLLNLLKTTIVPPDNAKVARIILGSCDMSIPNNGLSIEKRIWDNGLDKIVSYYTDKWNAEIYGTASVEKVKSLAIAAALCYIVKRNVESARAYQRFAQAITSAMPLVLHFAAQETVDNFATLYYQCNRFVDTERNHISKEEENNIKTFKNQPASYEDITSAMLTSWFLQSLKTDNPTSYKPLGWENRDYSRIAEYTRSSSLLCGNELRLLLT